MAQVEIWALPGYPLKESDWLHYGYTSLQDYVNKLKIDHHNHMRKACKICRKTSGAALVSFGIYNPWTDAKEIKLTCGTTDELPTTNIEGVLEFN